MKTHNQSQSGLSFSIALIALDAISLFLAASAASVLTVMTEVYVLDTPPYHVFPDVVETRASIYLVLCFFVLGMFWQKGLYSRRMPWWNQVKYIAKAVALALILDIFINFALKLYHPRLLILLVWPCAGFFTFCLRWLWFGFSKRFNRWKIPTVIIGDPATATDLIFAFSSDPAAGHEVHTVFLHNAQRGDFDLQGLPRNYHTVKVESDVKDYAAYIRQNPGDFYVICLTAFNGETPEALLQLLDETQSSYAIVPSISGIGFYNMEPRYFFGHDIMMLHTHHAAGVGGAPSAARMLKRAMDIGIAGTALLALSPLFGIVSLMLKAEGQGGTIFYGGERMGYRGRMFKCWKFRSMEPDSDHLLHAHLAADPQAQADWDKYRKLSNDPRITTRTARFIRKASIDELPQLWNVLAGDMSLVGPRPILEEEKSYFGKTLKDYMSVRPGLTGLWQVSGRNDTSFERRVYWDNWYIRNWSLWGDIVILIKTPLVLLTGKGAN